jgi:hypothetical protein
MAGRVLEPECSSRKSGEGATTPTGRMRRVKVELVTVAYRSFSDVA